MCRQSEHQALLGVSLTVPQSCPIANPVPPELKKPGTIRSYAHQSEAERMSMKAQDVALDRLLVDRFRQGDQSAFEQMVSRYWGRIYAMVHQLLRNPEDAEEVTQDTFIRAHRGLVNFRGESAFSTWLYQIATNLARNRYWYWWRRRRDKTVSFDQPIGGDNETTLAEVIPARRKIREIAAHFGLPMPELAMRAVLSRPEVRSVVVGVETLEQLRENAALFAQGALPPEVMAALEAYDPKMPERIVSPVGWEKAKAAYKA